MCLQQVSPFIEWCELCPYLPSFHTDTLATVTWTGLFHFHSEWTLIQNRNAHVNTLEWPYRSDPNEISFGFGGLVYTDWTGLHCPCKRLGIHEFICACVWVSFLWPTPKILIPSGHPDCLKKQQKCIIYRCYRATINQTHFKPSSLMQQQQAALSRTRAPSHASTCVSNLWRADSKEMELSANSLL